MTLLNLLNTFSNELSIPCRILPTSKIVNKFYSTDFSIRVKTIEFVAIHDNPKGDQNRGRVCLDNINIRRCNNI